MAMAGLSEGAVKPEESIACGGGISLGRRFAACHGSHGAPDVERAIAISCNGYFYRLSTPSPHRQPAALPFPTRSNGIFLYSYLLNTFIVPNSCPNLNDLHLPSTPPLYLSGPTNIAYGLIDS